jgi:hypothetical protein
VRFARIVFVVAGIWGLVVLTPFFWLVDCFHPALSQDSVPFGF